MLNFFFKVLNSFAALGDKGLVVQEVLRFECCDPHPALQRNVNVEKQGSAKSFAKYYCGTGDSRAFAWMAKPRPPVATSMD